MLDSVRHISFQMLDQSYFHTAQFSSIEHKKWFIDYNFFSCGNKTKTFS